MLLAGNNADIPAYQTTFMKHPFSFSIGLVVLASVSLVKPAFAVVTIDYVSIGDAGNAADTADGDSNTPGVQRYGAVAYAYNIGKYEVTNTQYVEFLNAKGASNSAGIFNGTMGAWSNITQSGTSGNYSYSVSSTYANMPVVGVSWFDAARFCNWLGNGQGISDMETGAYTLNGATSGIIEVNAGASVHIPSENEWYKAAYYNAATATYSLYPNGQNTITTADANYQGAGPVDVAYGNASSYGTFGQGGNAWEWNDAVGSGSSRGWRGGSWGYFDPVTNLASSFRDTPDASYVGNSNGFRIASAIPEATSALSTLTLIASGLLIRRRGKVSL